MKKFLLVVLICLSVFPFIATKKNSFEAYAEIKAKSSVLMDYESKTVISENNAKERRPIASMCKIMTLLLIFEEIDSGNLSFDEVLSISETAAGMGGSQAFLESNGKYTVKELIKSIVIASANDSCVALAERICGSERAFTDRMNERAEELGMNDTLFSNCTGLPKPTQYSTAKDVSIMFCQLLSHKDYYNFTTEWTSEFVHPKGRITELANTNKMIRNYSGCDGGKTGYTAEAGYCLSVTAKRGNMRLVAILIGSADSKTRFGYARELLDYGFDEYDNKMIINSNEPLDIPVKVNGGVKKNVTVRAEKDCCCFTKKNEEINVRVDFEPYRNVMAPVSVGDEVGILNIYKNDVKICEIKCVSCEVIDKMPFFGIIKDIMGNWSIA